MFECVRPEFMNFSEEGKVICDNKVFFSIEAAKVNA